MLLLLLFIPLPNLNFALSQVREKFGARFRKYYFKSFYYNFLLDVKSKDLKYFLLKQFLK